MEIEKLDLNDLEQFLKDDTVPTTRTTRSIRLALRETANGKTTNQSKSKPNIKAYLLIKNMSSLGEVNRLTKNRTKYILKHEILDGFLLILRFQFLRK